MRSRVQVPSLAPNYIVEICTYTKGMILVPKKCDGCEYHVVLSSSETRAPFYDCPAGQEPGQRYTNYSWCCSITKSSSPRYPFCRFTKRSITTTIEKSSATVSRCQERIVEAQQKIDNLGEIDSEEKEILAKSYQTRIKRNQTQISKTEKRISKLKKVKQAL